ncbi:MAG TPA: hypothetical protein VNG31_07665, partial [Candidatus Baltobacteraceae bacterium]|nr:hypothetical protein [Candidatus Baltobacteraceae bacterium]
MESIAVQPPALHAIDSATFPAIVTGLDAKGNAIVADRFTGARRFKSAINVVVDAASRNAVSVSKRTIAAPSDGTLTISYSSSNATAKQIHRGFHTTITVSSNTTSELSGKVTLSVAKPAVAQTSIPTQNAQPEAIAAGSDGALWFCEFGAAQVGRVTTSPFRVAHEYPTYFDNPYTIAAGSDGAMWVANWSGGGGITRISTDGFVTPYDLPVNTYPAGISSGPNGYLWYGSVQGNYVSWIAPDGTLGPQYALPPGNNYPLHSTLGPDGNEYFALQGTGQIAQVTPGGSIANLYTIPGASPSPQDVVSGPGSRIYFADTAQLAIFSMTPSGTFARWNLPARMAPSGPLAVGPDGKLWFAATNGVGRLDPNSGAIFQVPMPQAGTGPDGIALGAD